jgi:osmoprotectant transport system ATP-binding protein
VEVGSVPNLVVGEPVGAASEGWRLAVDERGHPRGWLPPETTVDGPLTEDVLKPGGSLFEVGQSIRGAMDAALSSPSGYGVAVSPAGEVVGVVTATQVLAVIEGLRESRG